MKWKRVWVALWLLTLLAIFIVTLINHSPYFLLGGSSSVAPIMEELLAKYPDNHKNGDFNYVSSASSGAPPRVESGLFGIGWLSQEYYNDNSSIIDFQLLRDGMVIVYNIPKENINNPDIPLNFSPQIVQQLYLENKSWDEVFPSRINTHIEVKTFTRPNGSGTRTVFDQKVLGGTTYYESNTVDSSSAMLSLDVGSIGYTSFADFSQAENKALVTAGTWNGVAATFANINKNEGDPDYYSLWRPFIGLINQNYKYKHEIANLLRWIFSEDSKVQEIFKKYGPRTNLDDNIALKNWLKDN